MFFSKLAMNTILKNKRDYFPFIFGSIITIILNLVVGIIQHTPTLQKMKGGTTLFQFLSFGSILIFAFTIIFLLYAHSFLAQKRKKEFGLYNILGMSKKDLGKFLFLETLFIFLISIVIGILVGLLFSKFMFMILLKLLAIKHMALVINAGSIVSVILLFAIIFFVLFLIDAWNIQRTKSIELLKAESMGEKEPKARIIVSIIGLLLLLAGYGLSLTISSPLDAITKFFIAVILVIAGTYILYMGGTITLLKLMKKNKKYYYQPDHFISTSGMLFRMRKNGVSLANIAILTTMTLVTFATTVGLYTGQIHATNQLAPEDYIIYYEKDAQKEKLDAYLSQNNIQPKDVLNYASGNTILSTLVNKNHYTEGKPTSINSTVGITLISQDDYMKLGNANPHLSGNKILIYDQAGKFEENSFFWKNTRYAVKVINEIKGLPKMTSAIPSMTLVVKDEAQRSAMQQQFKKSQENTKLLYHYIFNTNSLSEKQVKNLQKFLQDNEINATVRSDIQESFHLLTGGFLFVGILLGISFILAMGLIIYYKQISEGMDDQKRFDSLQKVGMSKAEVKKTINNQIIWVFILPILTAVIHLSFSLPIIHKLLTALNIDSMSVLLLTTAGTLAVMILIYGIIYKQTSKVYYDLVERKG